LGDLLVYSIGRYLGHNFLRNHPRFAHWLHEDREKQMEVLIQKHGLKVFFVARFMVGVRAPLYLAAGALRVPWRKFLLIDGICATVVVTVVFWLSHRYGRYVGGVIRNSQIAFTVIVVVIVVGVLIYFWIRRRPSKKEEQNEEDSPAAVEVPTDVDA
ncbi:MAG: DedA family protein, partial [Planctomycetales bacterium]